MPPTPGMSCRPYKFQVPEALYEKRLSFYLSAPALCYMILSNNGINRFSFVHKYYNKIIQIINDKYPNTINHIPWGLSSSFIFVALYMDIINGKKGLLKGTLSFRQ